MSGLPQDIGYRVWIYVDVDSKRTHCDIATPTAWFPRHELDQLTAELTENPPHLSFDGTHVKLVADNGTWVWRLTGRTYVHDYGPGPEPLVLCEGRWPD